MGKSNSFKNKTLTSRILSRKESYNMLKAIVYFAFRQEHENFNSRLASVLSSYIKEHWANIYLLKINKTRSKDTE